MERRVFIIGAIAGGVGLAEYGYRGIQLTPVTLHIGVLRFTQNASH